MIHYPVMLQNVLRSISALKLTRKIQIVDCNFGLGGHSNAILQHFPNSHITAYDLDLKIIKKYKQTPALHLGDQTNLTIINENYTHLIQNKNGNKKCDILLADLGFNSVQLEDHEGFSWNRDTPLDMRYKGEGEDCATLIGRLAQTDLMELLIKYGDLNFTEAKLVAGKMMECRPIKTTFQLRDAVVGCFQTNKTKKIAQVFQAMRIATNRELQSLKQLCVGLDQVMNKNGLILMITFHSLERDAIYRGIKEKKDAFSKIKIQFPSDKEINENSRSRSAQMLVFKKL